MRNTKIKTKTEKGITLIALIITIVVLLILAVVAINSIQNDGIISKAEQIANKYNESVQNEATQLQDYVDVLNQYTEGSSAGQNPVVYAKVSDAKNDETVFVVNTTLQDDFGNLVKVPAGFKIAEDSATAVTGGVVIEDATYTDTIGSQFVWVPTGTVYTSANKATSETIELNRYTFESDGTPVPQGDAVINSYYQESKSPLYDDLVDDICVYCNVSVDLDGFLASAKPTSEGGDGGYYIGRYENAIEDNKVVVKSGLRPTDQGYGRCYVDNELFDSDIVNSYAWDTAIVFIQTFGGDEAKNYAYSNYASTLTVTGGNGDEYCKINDMSGNAYELTTEIILDHNIYVGSEHCVAMRGGGEIKVMGEQGNVACDRLEYSDGIYVYSSRAILYFS